jgi:hypothetical protein
VLNGLRAVGSALAQTFTHFSSMLLANLLAMALSIPLILLIGIAAFGTRSLSLIPIGVALLIGVLPNPCAAGVQVIAHQLANDDQLTFKGHWSGLRQYAGLAASAWAVSLAVSAIILANAAFYAYSIGHATGLLHTLSIPLFLIWSLLFLGLVSIHLFVYPLLIEQEVKSIWLVYRNASLMALARPSVMTVVVPLWILVLVLSSATGLATFIGLAIAAAIQQNTTAKLLPTFNMRNAR